MEVPFALNIPLFRRSARRWLKAAARAALRTAALGQPPKGSTSLLLRMQLLALLGSPRFGIAFPMATVVLALSLGLLAQPPAQIGSDYIGTLWLAEAAVVGFAVAISVFAYESLTDSSSGRHRSVLLGGFAGSVTLGLSIVVLTGAGLLLEGAAGQWLRLFDLVLAPLWVVLLLFTFAQAADFRSRTYRVAQRSRILSDSTKRLLEAQLLDRAAMGVLRDVLTPEGGEFSPLLLVQRSDDEDSLVRAERRGTIVDASLESLRRAARAVKEDGGHLEISIRLGQDVSADSRLGQSDKILPPEARSAIQHSIVLSTRPSPVSLADQLQDLHLEATESLGPDARVLETVLTAYQGALQTYSEGWQHYVESLQSEYLPSLFEVVAAPIDAIYRSVGELMDAALNHDARDAAFQLSYFPVGLAVKAVGWKAPAYFRFLSLCEFLYTRASHYQSELASLLRERAWLHPVEGLELMLPMQQPPYVAPDPVAERLANEARTQLRRTVISILRRMIQQNDRTNFAEALRRLRLAEHHRTSP